jgi:hypothetical protein
MLQLTIAGSAVGDRIGILYFQSLANANALHMRLETAAVVIQHDGSIRRLFVIGMNLDLPFDIDHHVGQSAVGIDDQVFSDQTLVAADGLILVHRDWGRCRRRTVVDELSFQVAPVVGPGRAGTDRNDR